MQPKDGINIAVDCKDAKGRDIGLGDYVIIINPPEYPGVNKGDLGRFVDDRYLLRDGTVNVDVCSIVDISKSEQHCVNLTFRPEDTRKMSEGNLLRGRIPNSLSLYRLLRQYRAIRNYRSC